MNFKTYRKQSGMTQEEVAKALGIPKKTYQNYEYEVREPDSDILCSLADLYDVSLDELVGRESAETDTSVSSNNRNKQMSDEENELVSLYRSMDDDERGALIKVARALSFAPKVELDESRFRPLEGVYIERGGKKELRRAEAVE